MPLFKSETHCYCSCRMAKNTCGFLNHFYSLINPKLMALGKSDVTFMSCCIVGNAGAPPNENSIVPNPSAKSSRVTSLWGVFDIGVESGYVVISANNTTQATAVATVAPTAIGLKRNVQDSTITSQTSYHANDKEKIFGLKWIKARHEEGYFVIQMCDIVKSSEQSTSTTRATDRLKSIIITI